VISSSPRCSGQPGKRTFGVGALANRLDAPSGPPMLISAPITAFVADKVSGAVRRLTELEREPQKIYDLPLRNFIRYGLCVPESIARYSLSAPTLETQVSQWMKRLSAGPAPDYFMQPRMFTMLAASPGGGGERGGVSWTAVPSSRRVLSCLVTLHPLWDHLLDGTAALKVRCCRQLAFSTALSPEHTRST